MRLPDDSSLTQAWTMIFGLQVLPEEQPEPSSNLGLSSVERWAYLGCVFHPGRLRLDLSVKFHYGVNFREKSINFSG